MSTHAAKRPGGTSTTREPHRNGGVAGLFALTAITEVRSSLRSVEFAVGAVTLPILLYAMFGLPNAASLLPAGTRVALGMLVSLCAYGVVSLAIFTFGEDVAKERGRGWIRTLRATPFPTGVHLAAKTASAVVHAAMIVVAMFTLAATAGGVRMPAVSWLALATIMLAGVLLFSTLGFAIAFLVRPRAATVIANLIFFPLAFASGFFVPLGELPAVLRDVAQYLPTYHFGQLAYRTVMPIEDVEYWTGAAVNPIWVNVAWVLGSAVVLGALALLAARREAVTGRG